MRKNDFEELVSSIKEAGKVKRGVAPASRRFEVSPVHGKGGRQNRAVARAAPALR